MQIRSFFEKRMVAVELRGFSSIVGFLAEGTAVVT